MWGRKQVMFQHDTGRFYTIWTNILEQLHPLPDGTVQVTEEEP